MKIQTDSIKELLEIMLNKKMDSIDKNDLEKITYLRLCKTDIMGIWNVDSSDLQYFPNIEELMIEKCMVDIKMMEDINRLPKLKKITFLSCDIVDDLKDYFEKMSIDELVLNDVIGLNNIVFSNIKKLTFVNMIMNCRVENVLTLDISHSIKTNIDYDNSYVKELIISEEEYIHKMYNNKWKIIVKDNYEEVIQVINNG